jgi:hypothetical protein
MNIENVSINYSQKFNLGNYESVEISVMLHARTEQDEPADGVAEFLIEKAKESVYKQAKIVTDAHDVTCSSIQKYYMGKKIDKLPSEVTKAPDIYLRQLDDQHTARSKGKNKSINYDRDYSPNNPF